MYRIFNIALDSQIPIPELGESSEISDTNVFVFSLGELNSGDSYIEWFHHWPDPDGRISISAGRKGDSYWLRFPDMVDFEMHLEEQSIIAYKQGATPDTTIRHMLLDQVIPRVLGQQGNLVLHAGAVTLTKGKTAAFIGQSGWGKSTLVSSFQQQGAELITDDCLMIEQSDNCVLAIPNYYGIRLFDDSIKAIFGEQEDTGDVAHYSSKRRLILPDSGEGKEAAPLQLDAIYLLSDHKEGISSDQINITSTGGMDAMMTLVAQTFVLDVTDKQMMAEQFRNCGKIFDSEVPCFQLDYPRDHGRLDEVRKAIESVLE